MQLDGCVSAAKLLAYPGAKISTQLHSKKSQPGRNKMGRWCRCHIRVIFTVQLLMRRTVDVRVFKLPKLLLAAHMLNPAAKAMRPAYSWQHLCLHVTKAVCHTATYNSSGITLRTS
jgi:hypothetical protein